MHIVINPIKAALSNAPGDFHVLVRLQSIPDGSVQRTPLNLVLVIDRSGSMSGAKLAEAKRCAIDLVQHMAPSDKVGVVQYDDEVDVLIALDTVEACMPRLQAAVEAIFTNGSTNLHGGWLKAGEMLAAHAGSDAVCHVMLLSDGIANHGVVAPGSICEQVGSLASAGITTTTVGLGADFNEQLMTAIAQAGQGRAHYGERAIDLAETFEAELGLLSNLQWRTVELVLAGAPQGTRMLNDYAPAEAVGGASWRMPAIAMGAECWALLQMPLREAFSTQHRTGTLLSVLVHAVDASGEQAVFRAHLDPLPVASAEDFAGLPVHEVVQRRIHEMRAAQLQLGIREAVLRGDWEEASRILRDLESLGREEPWVAASIDFVRGLIRERDEQRTSKEMMYKSRKMSQRLASVSEEDFSVSASRSEAAYMRRKPAEGRRTEPGGNP